MSDKITTEQAQRIGELYGKALANYDDFGEFQLALSNSMAHRPYNWDMEQFECILEAIVELEASTSVPRMADAEWWDEYVHDK